MLRALLLVLVLASPLWAGSYTITIVTTPEDEEALTLMYHKECAERRDGVKPMPPLDPQDRDCAGTAAGKAAYLPYRIGNVFGNEKIIVRQVKAACDAGQHDKASQEGRELCAAVGK